MQEHYDVRVLLDRSTFTQVREHRSWILSLFQFAIQLRQRQYGEAELLGELLTPAANLGRTGPFSHVFRHTGRLAQLQVVDNDQL